MSLNDKKRSSLPTSSTTSMEQRRSGLASALILSSTLLLGAGTTANALTIDEEDLSQLPLYQQSTNSGFTSDDATVMATAEVHQSVQSTRAAIGDLRRITGLTWDKLAEIFNVSRRSLHLWASGKSMSEPNEERLRRILAIMHKIDRGRAAENRALLLTPRDDGLQPIQYLRAGEYERLLNELGLGAGRERPGLTPLSQKAKQERRPQTSPAALLAAEDEPIHIDNGRLLSAKPLRPPKDEE